MMGLAKEHHAELNRQQTSRERYAELRQEYEGDSVALQQIDVYDRESPYCDWIRKYVIAWKENDTDTVAECEEWFSEHYPDIGAGGA